MNKGIKVLLVILFLILIGTFWVAKDKFQKQPQPQPTANPLSKLILVISFVKANQLPLIVANEKGLFKKYNLDVEIKQVDKNATSVLSSGNADVTLGTPNISLTAAVQGSKLSWIGNINNDQATVVVSTKDLQKIRTVGVITGPSTAQTLGMLSTLGANMANITTQNLSDTNAKLIALKEKKVDAIHVPKPDWLIFKRQSNLSDNEYTVLTDSSTDPRVYMPIGIITRNEFLKNNKQTVENFAKALLEADFWIQNNKEEFVTLVKKSFSNIPAEDAEITAQTYLETIDNLQFTPTAERAEDMRKLVAVDNPKAKDYDLNNFINTTISDSLKSSGFLKQFNFN